MHYNRIAEQQMIPCTYRHHATLQASVFASFLQGCWKIRLGVCPGLKPHDHAVQKLAGTPSSLQVIPPDLVQNLAETHCSLQVIPSDLVQKLAETVLFW